jgi:hypothetical protein
MSSQPTPASAAPPPEELPAGEAQLGRTLALIHRVLPRLDDLDRADAVQEALRQASSQLEAARAAHERWLIARRPAAVDSETLALIAAAVSVVLGRAHRVLEVQKASVSVAWVNAWAMEGRFAHYSSHKVR